MMLKNARPWVHAFLFSQCQSRLGLWRNGGLKKVPRRRREKNRMFQKGGARAAALAALLCFAGAEASALPLFSARDLAQAPAFADAEVVPVVVFGRDSRRGIEDYAAEHKLDPKELKEQYTASGLIECGAAHGAGQLTLVDDLVTTAAHVFFDEAGAMRAKTCLFVIESDGKEVKVPIDLGTITAGSRDPYAISAVHDWAVAKLTKPIHGVQPYRLGESAQPKTPVEFVARGHIDWGDGRRLSVEKCLLHDELDVGDEGTREFSFDCETGDGASGGALMTHQSAPTIGAILVGWRSNKPFRSAPFSKTHYNFAVTIEGAFRQAVLAAASQVVVSNK
jgi:hypothetical protein